MVKYKERKRLRILGKVLFVCYVLFIIYFLLFSEWYGRTGEMSEYRYNLVLYRAEAGDERCLFDYITHRIVQFNPVTLFESTHISDNESGNNIPDHRARPQ